MTKSFNRICNVLIKRLIFLFNSLNSSYIYIKYFKNAKFQTWILLLQKLIFCLKIPPSCFLNLCHPLQSSAQLLPSEGEAVTSARLTHFIASPLRGEAGRRSDEGEKTEYNISLFSFVTKS